MYLILVAGGSGRRMGAEVPKQFMLLGDRPIIMRTMERFVEALPEIKIILVLNKEYFAMWHELCEEYSFDLPYTLAEGGQERFHSVRNGLQMIPSDVQEGVVGVHDAVRPLVGIDVIRACFAQAKQKNAVVPVVGVVDSVRMKSGVDGSMAIKRSDVMLVQTPQVFSLSVLRKAYAQPFNPAFTDDASIVEAAGQSISTIEGNRENIKITTPFDLEIAKMFIAMQ